MYEYVLRTSSTLYTYVLLSTWEQYSEEIMLRVICWNTQQKSSENWSMAYAADYSTRKYK